METLFVLTAAAMRLMALRFGEQNRHHQSPAPRLTPVPAQGVMLAQWSLARLWQG